MKTLLAEDDDPKRENMEKHLTSILPKITIDSVGSVRSAIDSLRANSYDLLILDMSLPTFDISRLESGGRPQSAGGIEVLDFLTFSDESLPVVIVTQHEAFDYEGRIVSLEDLVSKLEGRFRTLFSGLVQYNTISGLWKKQLGDLVERIVRNK